jgi:hypothetical protein
LDLRPRRARNESPFTPSEPRSSLGPGEKFFYAIFFFFFYDSL